MKRAFLLIAVPALLVALSFAQTPAPITETDQTNIKGCLGGSDGNYTVVEDNTGHIFKISTSSVDLKPHLGHDVTLIGQRTSETSSTTDANSFAVTELKMISERCTAAATPAATVTTPAETAVPPAAAVPAATVAAPTEIAAAPALIATEPAATVTTPAETAVTPAPAAAEPAATISAPAEIANTPAAAAAHPKPLSAGRRVSASPASAATVPATATPETVSTPAAAATSPETDSTPPAAATTPAKTAKTGSFAIFIAFAVLVILLGILAPFLRRWRKRRMLEGTDAPNLSFTHDSKSDEDKSDPPITRKAA